MIVFTGSAGMQVHEAGETSLTSTITTNDVVGFA